MFLSVLIFSNGWQFNHEKKITRRLTGSSSDTLFVKFGDFDFLVLFGAYFTEMRERMDDFTNLTKSLRGDSLNDLF